VKIEYSDKRLDEVLDFQDLERLFANFAKLTGIDVSLHDIEGQEVLRYRIHPEKSICELVKARQSTCNLQMQYAGKKALELGEPYIFQCGTMIKCAAAVLFEEKYLGCLACGPVLLWEADEIARRDLADFAAQHEVPAECVCEILEAIKQLTPETMRSASQMLSLMVDHMCQEESIFLSQRNRLTRQQDKIAELMSEKRQAALSLQALERQNKFKKYSYEMEKELIAFVRSGETVRAHEILNGILGEIFAIAAGNLDIIKANVYELTAVLIRAAVDAGIPLTDLAHIIRQVTRILAEESQYDEVCLLTTEVLEEIIAVLYENRFKKQGNEHLMNAIQFIRKHYSEDLSLNEVAKNVFVSGYYLSHLFREELDITFSDYLNKIRMEAAIKLMKEKNHLIQDIAAMTGFKDAAYFCKAFKKYNGLTPKKYMTLL
jgi:two-component system response regulator YesN